MMSVSYTPHGTIGTWMRDFEAAEFLRLSGGLPTLLSHCYADPELPLLREAGVYAVRPVA